MKIVLTLQISRGPQATLGELVIDIKELKYMKCLE